MTDHKPRESEAAHLLDTLGYIPVGAKSARRRSTLNLPLRLGADPDTEIGREAIHEREQFLPWLREQFRRDDDIGQLASALLRHEAGGLDEDLPQPDGWVCVASRVIRGVIVGSPDRTRLRAALDAARAEFAELSSDESSDGRDG